MTDNAPSYGPKVYRVQGGDTMRVKSGGLIDIETGGDLKYNGDSLIDEIAALSGLDATELGFINGATSTPAASKVAIHDSAGFLRRTMAALAAAGNAQADAAAIATDVVAVTGADGTKGVALPAAAAGLSILVINTVATATLKVYPVNGGNDAINGETAGTGSVTLAPGASAVFTATSATQWYTPARGLVATAQPFPIDLRTHQGGALAVTEAAGTFNRSVAANVELILGEVTDNETEVSVGTGQIVLPRDYVPGGAITVRLRSNIVKVGAAVDNGSTLDVEAFKSDGSGAVGADICATPAATFAAVDTWYNKDFTITPTGLVAGDRINLKVTATTIDNEAGGGTLTLNMETPQALIDVKAA